ncbi:MAG: hypothetical protein IJ298_04120 [Ruminococcus sp.]|nr:hypothetical protein [Ruminococcus sp.]
MKYMDTVELIAERDTYTKEGVHKGMQGWICNEEKINNSWLVNFPQCGEKEDIATLGVKEKDLKIVPSMNAIINEQIKEQFGD